MFALDLCTFVPDFSPCPFPRLRRVVLLRLVLSSPPHLEQLHCYYPPFYDRNYYAYTGKCVCVLTTWSNCCEWQGQTFTLLIHPIARLTDPGAISGICTNGRVQLDWRATLFGSIQSTPFDSGHWGPRVFYEWCIKGNKEKKRIGNLHFCTNEASRTNCWWELSAVVV